MSFDAKGGAMTRILSFVFLLAVIAGGAFAATPPATVNFEGVLRDQNGNPLSGTYGMIFRFMNASTFGDEIMTNQQLNANAVTVSGGLFNVALAGTGVVLDGSGPGLYLSLADVFRDHSGVWLEIQVGSTAGGGLETLSPRVRFLSSPYALNATNAVSATNATNAVSASNAANLNGLPANNYIDTSSTLQTKFGQLQLNNASGVGIDASGGTVGIDASGGTVGISASGTDGGHFFGTDFAVKATGGAYAGHFIGGTGGSGIYAWGNTYGVHAGGGTGGYFENNSSGVSATLATVLTGIDARGWYTGGYFANGSPYFSYAHIPNYDIGIDAWGSAAGGLFRNFGSGAYGYVGYSIYKIQGSGAVSFVQNHPADSSKVIVYAAPEGDEVAVYTRGSGRLVNGESRVALGKTFAHVANPDIGLTATVTPTGEVIPLAVIEKSTHELVVRGPAGSNAAFDYAVWGLRIGFEELSIIQPRRLDSKIPSMHMNEEFFKDEPELRDYTALARFKGVEETVHGKRPRDFSRADELRNAVGVFVPRPADAPPPDGWRGAPEKPSTRSHGEPGTVPQDDSLGMGSSPAGVPAVSSRPTDMTATADVEPVDAPEVLADLSGRLYPSVIMKVEDLVEAGDVLSLDATSPGAVVRSAGAGDPLVIGCARAVEPGSIPDGLVAVDTGHITLCRVDASYGAVGVGDRLVASPSPGIAMKVGSSSADTGVFGRAIEPLEAGSGLIRVLVTVR